MPEGEVVSTLPRRSHRAETATLVLAALEPSLERAAGGRTPSVGEYHQATARVVAVAE